jgi:murein DD-endopeptidase MepM/ murein hydrolase activator NlpD
MDLAKVDPRGTSTPRITANRDTTIPRGNTDQPTREINAVIRRPSMDSADELSRILGLANNVGQNIANDVFDQQRKDQAAAGAADFAAGQKNEEQFKNLKAYREAWQLQGAKKLALDIGNEATSWATDRLNDSDNPATLDEIDHGIESIFQKHVTDGNGKLLDFGPAEAKTTLANALSEIRSNLLPQAQAAIKKQTDTRLLTTWAENNVHEFYRGAPIGAPPETRVAPSQDPLAPLPDAQVVPTTSTPFASPVAAVAPFKGFGAANISSGIGAAREGGSKHNGEDYPVPVGTNIVAPMAGEVVSVFSNARGGNQLRVKLADGSTWGFAHLSSTALKQGDKVGPGDILAISGNTGHTTGAHVHVTVKDASGKLVSPSHYFANAKAPSGLPQGPALVSTPDDPVLAQGTPPDLQVGMNLPPFDFERALSQVPPSISKTQAKSFLLQSLVNEANQRGDIGLLRGLEDSKQKDGTPSLTPEEIATVQQARTQITDRVRVEAANQRKQLWDKNADAITLAFLSPKPPSIGFLRNAAHQGLIDPSFGFTMENWVTNQAREQVREDRADARQAKYEAQQLITQDISSRIALRNSGDLSEASVEEDNKLLHSGQLGTGTFALSNYRALRAAARAGEQENLRRPEVAAAAGRLKQKFGKTATDILSQAYAGGNKVNFPGMIAYFRDQVAKGVDPNEAEYQAEQKFAPKSKDAAIMRVQRIQELRAKRLAGQ